MAKKSKVVTPVVVETNSAGEETKVQVGSQVCEVQVIETNPSSLLTQALAQINNEETTVEVEPQVEVKPKVEKNDGVGIFIRNLINEGLSNKDILKIVHEQYGNKNTTYACVAWYRNKMKKSGQDVKKASNLEFITNFAKVNNLSEEAVSELKGMMKVG